MAFIRPRKQPLKPSRSQPSAATSISSCPQHYPSLVSHVAKEKVDEEQREQGAVMGSSQGPMLCERLVVWAWCVCRTPPNLVHPDLKADEN